MLQQLVSVISVNGKIKVWADREEGVVGHAFF